jgi:hypothetical protein
MRHAVRPILNILYAGQSQFTAETQRPQRTNPRNDALLRLDSGIVHAGNYRKRQCDFWDYLLALRP